MRISRLLTAIAATGAALGAAVTSAAEQGGVQGQNPAASEVRWENFDALDYVPESGLTGERPSNSVNSLNRQSHHAVELGPLAVDSEGRRGRIHTVAAGDTLWDISDLYLGTPWVWPSVWRENEIADPHVIEPDDRIWISSTEMRLVSKNEADELIANQIPEPPASESEPEIVAEPLPLLTPGADTAGALSLAAAPARPKSTDTGRSLHVPWRENFGFVSDEVLRAKTSIVGSPSARTWLAGDDLVYLGLGRGDVEVGQDFTIFRDAEEIRDAKSDALIGYHINVLGWVRVEAVDRQSSIARLMSSNSEVARGDFLVPRNVRSPTVAIRRARDAMLGHIVYLPSNRTVMGMGDYVYIDRGALHGLEIGSELEIFERGFDVKESVTQSLVHIPDEVVATLVVVEMQPTSAVAYVVHTQREVEVGDLFRTKLMSDSLASIR